MKNILFVILLAVLSLNAFGQTQGKLSPAADDVVKIEDVYLAKDDGSGEAGEAVEKFQIGDIPIYCVIQLSSIKSVNVKMSFIAVAVKGVKADTKVVSVSYKTDGNQDRVNFTGKPDKFWTAGSYRVDIFINDKLAESKSFEIEKSAASPAPQVNSFQPKQTPKSKPGRNRRKN